MLQPDINLNAEVDDSLHFSINLILARCLRRRSFTNQIWAVNDMERIMGNKGPAQLTAWIDNGREAGAEQATVLRFARIQQVPSLPQGNSRLVVLKKMPAAV